MVKERYCSYEVSKLLKEKGFPQDYDVYHSMVYNEKDYEDEYEVQRMVTKTQFIKAGTLSSYPVGVPEPKCYAPTHQMAIDWLREKHGIFIEIFSSIDLNGNYHYSYNVLGSDCKYIRKGYTSFDWEYKDTVEAALEYCLTELI